MKKLVALLIAAILLVGAMPALASEGPVKLVYMTSWGDKVEYNNYIAEAGARFAEAYPELCSGVEILPVEYAGYEAKFQTALASGTNVCDIFQGQPQTYHDYADPMPEEFAAWLDENVVDYLVDIGVYDGVRYGVPQEAGNFQQLYINIDMFKEAGLDPAKDFCFIRRELFDNFDKCRMYPIFHY